MRSHRSAPNGFTLVELLVVMALMAVLAGLTIAFLPTAASAERESRAASQLQGWLNVAKQRALRDRAPRGLRLLYGDVMIGSQTINNAVIECQYLEQPDDFTGGTVRTFPAIPIVNPAAPSIFWSGPPGNIIVTITTSKDHYFYVGETVTITNNTLWSSSGYVEPPLPIPPMPPPPTGTPREFRGNHTVTAVPGPRTFQFLYTGADPVPEPPSATLPATYPVSKDGSVSSGNRLLFYDNSGGPLDLMNGYYPPPGADSATATLGTTTVKLSSFWSIQPGDYIEVLGTGMVSRITRVDTSSDASIPGGNVQPNEVKISRALPFAITWPTPNYRILRASRAVGDETLKLPDDTVIDLGTNVTFGNPLPLVAGPVAGTGYVDILFSPSGSVVTRGFASSTINLWVRAPDPNSAATFADPYKGAPTIVSVFVRTGFVGAFPPDRTSAYALVK